MARGQIDLARCGKVTGFDCQVVACAERQSACCTLNVCVDDDVAGHTRRRQVDCPAATCCDGRTNGFRAARKQKDIAICRGRDGASR